MKLSSGQRRLRVAIKRFIYSQLYMRDALLMMFAHMSKQTLLSTVSPGPKTEGTSALAAAFARAARWFGSRLSGSRRTITSIG